MNSVLIFVLIVHMVAVCKADSNFTCPQTYLADGKLKPLTLNNILGNWYTIRTTPSYDDKEEACNVQTLWIDSETPENTVNVVYSLRENDTLIFSRGSAGLIPLSDGQVDNQWNFESKGYPFPTVFVDSDEGKQWIIAHICTANESKSLWSLMSRTKTMDPKLEQVLAEKIEKYSDIPQNKLRGIQQSGCYDKE